MKKTFAIIGEGITEKYYIESLRGLSPFTILPRELGKKASSLRTLENYIKESVEKGFDEVYCLIDMDGKTSGSAQASYIALKTKYDNKIFGKKSKGSETKIYFIETERCIELWFLFYFTKNPITRKFISYEDLAKELKKYIPGYEKTERYFKAIKSIHLYFEKNNPPGSLISAYNNSQSSMSSNLRDSRGYTYSEMHKLIKAIGIYDADKA